MSLNGPRMFSFARAREYIYILAVVAAFLAVPARASRDLQAEADLSSTDVSKRISAALKLQAAQSVESIPALRAALKQEESAKIRATFLGALGALSSGDSTVLNDLEAGLKDSNPQVRLEAVAGIGRFSSTQATADLVSELTGDSDPGVRRMAAVRLAGKTGDVVVAALVNAAEKDSDAGVRTQAVYALGWASQASAKNALKQAAKDADAGVRGAANQVTSGQ